MIRSLAAALLLLAALATPAWARSLVVEGFDALITVEEDASILVEERLRVRFEGSWNGIFREIPTRYEHHGGVRGRIVLELEAITDSAGRPLEHWRERAPDGVRFKIRVPGAHDATREVRIRYRARNVLRPYDADASEFGGHDELYWNVTGTGSRLPIERAEATVTLPDTVPADAVRTTAWTGPYRARGSEARTRRLEDGRIRFTSEGMLGPGEGLTIAVAFPPGHVRHPSGLKRMWWIASANWFVGIPWLLLLLWGVVWWSRGHDDLGARTIIPEWRPPLGLRAAEVGVVVDDTVDTQDVSAAIVDLAVRGVLTIHQEDEDDFELERHPEREAEAELEPFEEELLEALYVGDETRVDLGSLKRKFWGRLEGIRRKLLDDLCGKGIFPKAPDEVASRWTAGTALVLGIAVLGGMLGRFPWPYWVSLVAAAVGMLVVARHMPRRTRLGLDALARVRGMELYMQTAEKERMAKLPLSHFERLLPFAVALGLHDRWTAAFEDLLTQPPAWLQTDRGWTEYTLGRAVGRMNDRVGSTLFAAPRTQGSSSSGFGGSWSGGSGFSGGGFSGGGFGGGSVGGW